MCVFAVNIEFYILLCDSIFSLAHSGFSFTKIQALNDDDGDDDAVNIDHELFECALKNYSQSRKWSHFY